MIAWIIFFLSYLWAGAPPCEAADDEDVWDGIDCDAGNCDAGNEERGADGGRPGSRDGMGAMGTV